MGLTAQAAQVANVLRQVTVQLVANKVCNGFGSYSGAITDRMIGVDTNVSTIAR